MTFLQLGSVVSVALLGASVGCARSTLPDEGALPSLDGATGWINSPPLSAADLRGKVVLVNFWTYSCINWRRSLPYVRAWAEKYKDRGLVVIGIHSPEFAFEKNVDNVTWAATAMRIEYPIAIDSSHTLWRAFENDYWPALYFVDTHGRIRHHQFGEGDYEQSELVLQRLLSENGSADSRALVTVDPRGAELPADWSSLGSAETYLGSNHGPAAATLLGAWTQTSEASVATTANTRLRYKFRARDLHAVMGPTIKGALVRFRVTLDGRQVSDDHGDDVDTQGNGVAREQRMYQLLRQQGPIVDREIEIEFLDPGVEVFALTFG